MLFPDSGGPWGATRLIWGILAILGAVRSHTTALPLLLVLVLVLWVGTACGSDASESMPVWLLRLQGEEELESSTLRLVGSSRRAGGDSVEKER